MLKDKLERLMKYKARILDRLEAPVNAKHKNHPRALKQYLTRELEAVTNKIAELRLEMTAK